MTAPQRRRLFHIAIHVRGHWCWVALLLPGAYPEFILVGREILHDTLFDGLGRDLFTDETRP